MSATSDRKLMSPVDVTKLFKLTWAYLDAREEWEADYALVAPMVLAREALVVFIAQHPIEFFDLISRGRSDTAVRNYRPNAEGKLIPYAYDTVAKRELTLREMFHAPGEKEDDADLE